MNLETWYGSNLIPTHYGFDSEHKGYIRSGPSYGPFVANSLGLVNTLGLEGNIPVTFQNCSTAYADTDNGKIVISYAFYSGDWSGAGISGRLPIRQNIECLLGVIVHEAAHFAWSPKKLTAFEEGMTGEWNGELLRSIGNIIEDIYIEDRVAMEYSRLAWMLDAVGQLMFPADGVKKMRAAILAGEGLAQNSLNLALWGKVHPRPMFLDSSDCPRIATQIFDLADSVRGMNALPDRVRLAQEIYRLLVEETDTEDLKVGDPSTSKLGEPSDGPTPHVPSDAIVSATKTERLAKDILAGRQSIDILEDSGSLVIRRVPEPHHGAITPNPVFTELAQIARQRATVNRPYGLPEKRGHNIRRLHRIATDSKIFAPRVEMSGVEPMEILFLIDASSSMHTGIGSDILGKSKILASVEAAVGGAVAMSSARCPVAVWAHTADVETAHVMLYRIKGWSEPLSVLTPRAAALAYRSGLLCQNRDGDAITAVAKEFGKSSRRQVMIVISDGSPCALNYYGPSANNDSARRVQEVRARGIEVLSISIEEYAMEVNNHIYGAANNVYAEDPNVISQIARTLIG